ncbi:MAG: polyprenyl synthetase family protein [Pseudomonadales bacterium]|nr:polyprenyl synthetase family protein [Pseudomonadales bacterium]
MEQRLALPQVPERLREAMHYTVFNGGKRIRPILVYLTAEALGKPAHHVDSIAAAIEMMHCYSLAHDDLPAMDDDDLRRGNPTVHIKFDEATAILAGDALQTLAFEQLVLDTGFTAAQKVTLVTQLAQAAGAAGMVAGQMIDMEGESREISAAELENMHRRKTGDLIAACLRMSACACAATDEQTQALEAFGYALGLAFQVQDDILDITGDQARIGKTAGSDITNNKTTFISAYGLEGATRHLQALFTSATEALTPLGQGAADLRRLAEFIVTRDH